VVLAQGDVQHAVDVLSETLRELDRRSGTRPGMTTRATVIRLLALSFLTRALAELGRFKEGIACGEEALRLAEPNTAFGLATALAGLGILYVRKADLATAIPLLERGLEVSQTYSVTNWLPTIEATLGTAYVLAGRVDDGVVLLERAVDLNRHTGIVATLSLWRTYLGDAYLKAGRFAEAAAEARRALEECRARLEHGYEPWALFVCAGILAGAEPPDLAEAQAHYLEALKLAEPRGMRPLVVRCVMGLARLHERGGEVAAAASYRDRGARLADELDIPLASLDAA
jgi:tetratricopeptide (TPR) repeat protein